MSQSFSKSASKADTATKGGVHYFSHFPKAFLVPYGKPKEELYNESRLLDSLKAINCEWLTRPSVAASKLAETMNEQVRILGDTIQTVDLERVAEYFDAFAETIANFNTRNKKNNVTRDDVDGLVEALLSPDPDMETMILQAEKIGQAVYLMSIHHRVAQALITRYDCMAEQSQHKDGLDIHFKRDPSLRTLTDYLLTTIVGRQSRPASTPARRDLLSEFQSMRRDDRGERGGRQLTRTVSPTRSDRRSLSPRRPSTSTSTSMETPIPRRPRALSPTVTATTTARPRLASRRTRTPSPTGSEQRSPSPKEETYERPSVSRMRMRSVRPTTSTTLRNTPVRRRSMVPSEPETQARPDRLPWRKRKTPAAQLPEWTDETEQWPQKVEAEERLTRRKRPIFDSEDEEHASPSATVLPKQRRPLPAQEPQEMPPEMTREKKKKRKADKEREATKEVTVTEQAAATTALQSQEQEKETKKKKKKKEKEGPTGLKSLIDEYTEKHCDLPSRTVTWNTFALRGKKW